MKRYFWKILPVFLCVLIIVSAIPFSVNAAATVITVDTAQELTDACAQINNNGGEYVISLNKDISGPVSVDISNSDAVVTIIGNGHTINSTGNAVTVSNSATVNLGDGNSDLTLKSANDVEDPGVVFVLDNGICNMYDKVTVKDHKGNNYLGGGVTVQGATFHMYGGTIDNCGIEGGSVCYGGGVAVYAGGVFIMDDGVISNCYATTDYIDSQVSVCYAGVGGGVFVIGGATFEMNGGTISNCSATNFGGGVAMMLGDTEYRIDPNTGNPVIDPKTNKKVVDQGNPRSKITINGGKICENKAKSGAGIFVSGYYYAFYNAALAPNLVIGEPSNPGISINGGENKNVEISSNTATEMGGGVLVAGLKDTQKTQLHNANINCNTASTGAGVMNYKYWTQIDIDGCTIIGNEASSNGGGIAALSNSGQEQQGYTKINNTTIKDNTSGDRGAGVYYDADSEVRISGADVIQDNTYNGKTNNLNVLSLEKPIKVVGELTGSQIGLSDPTLWDDDKSDTDAGAVSTERLTDGYKENNDSLIPANVFTSDHESWYVDYGELGSKTVASDDDYYTYEGKKYNVSSRVDTGESCRGEIYEVKANTFTTGVAENPDVFKQEVLSRFSDTNKYQLEYSDANWNDYTKLDTGEPVSVYFPNIYNAYIYLNPNSNYSNPRLITSTGHQTQYASNGQFVYQYYTANSETIDYSDSFETLEITDNELFDSDRIIYDYDEFGHIISKTVVNKTPTKTPHQETIIPLEYNKEVRLVRRTTPIKFHVNNPNSADDELFRVYNPESGETYTTENGVYDLTNYQVHEFYDIPAFAEDDYVFAGWYTTENNNNNSSDNAFEFDSAIPAGVTDVYAHWIPVGEVDQDEEDDKILPNNANTYKGFDLFGVQIRRPYKFDNNQGDFMPEGLRFVTSISEDLLSDIDSLSDKTVNGNKVEYGYVTAGESTVSKVVEAFQSVIPSNYKLQYKGENVNGIDTTVKGDNKNNFNYITNLDCTSTQGGYGSNSRIKTDHKNFGEYRLATFVITYEDDASGDNKGKNIAARAYLRYYDVNGLLRTFYNDYAGTDFYGGCSTCYNAVAQ